VRGLASSLTDDAISVGLEGALTFPSGTVVAVRMRETGDHGS